MNRRIVVSLAFCALAVGISAGPFAQAQNPNTGAPPSAMEFGGTWDVKDTFNARYSLMLHVNPDSTVVGQFNRLDGGGSGSVTGAVSNGVLGVTWTSGRKTATGTLRIYPDGTIGGPMNVTSSYYEPPRNLRWVGTRRSRQVGSLGVHHTQ